MKKILAVAFGAIFCCTQVFAFDVSPTQVNTGIKKNPKVQIKSEFLKKLFNKKSFASGIEMVSVTDDGMRLSSVRGDLSSPLQGDLVKAAKSYIAENAEIFNLPKVKDANLLKPVRVETTDNAKHVAFQMVIDGVEVSDARIELHLNSEDVVTLAHGSLPTIREINNEIVLGKYQAIGQAKVAIKANKFRAVPEAELKVWPERNGTARMVYETKLAVEKPLGDWKIIIDAETGEVVDMNNEMAFVTGRGALYVTNPLICEITEEGLYHLTTHKLKGKYADIVNEDVEEAFNEEDVHIYDVDNTHFDEVNMYNYITTIHDFYKNTLGHTKLDKPMRATVHLGTNYDNAYFSPWQGGFAFGDGNRFNDLAKEASIAYHEYSHAVLHSIVYLAYSAESGAMNEGQADYFACTVTEDPKLGEWAVAKMGRDYLRILETDLHYPEDIEGEVHADGKIWGSVLWDIRKAIGKADADKLIYKAHHYLKSGSPKFIDGYNALITADENEFGGKHLEALAKVMQKRGIIAANYNGAVLTKKDLSRTKKFLAVHGEL